MYPHPHITSELARLRGEERRAQAHEARLAAGAGTVDEARRHRRLAPARALLLAALRRRPATPRPA